MARKTKTLAEQLAELDNPAPKDFDPEEEAPQSDSEAEFDDDDNAAAAREHYVDVGKSKLRKRDVVPLGPRYEGSKVSRHAVTGDDDEDDPFSRGFDDEESEDEADGAPEVSVSEDGEEDEEGEDESEEEDEELEDGDESPATDLSDEDDEDDDEDDDEEQAGEERAEVRKMMAEEQKSVAASLSQAAKQDADKGRAVKTQRQTFDSLLNSRIKLQKALIAANSLSSLDDASTDDADDAFRAAETAAFTLWSSLNSLRESLQESRTGHKRKRPDFDIDTPTEDLWSHMRAQEASSQPTRHTVLEKWSAKARGATAIAPRNRLNNTETQQTIIHVLQEQLHSSDRLIKRARTPRSCAPLQLSRKLTEADNIYDDADFYGILLQSLLEQRSADSVAASASNNIDVSFQMRREAKTKKQVDTKASKGRKLRYTVHEKLQNFMAPEDRNAWGERQADELFGSLFGQRMGLGEEDDAQVDEEEMEVADMEEAGLMMFRS